MVDGAAAGVKEGCTEGGCSMLDLSTPGAQQLGTVHVHACMHTMHRPGLTFCSRTALMASGVDADCPPLGPLGPLGPLTPLTPFWFCCLPATGAGASGLR